MCSRFHRYLMLSGQNTFRMFLLSRRFSSWTRLLLALSLAAAVVVFPCRARADDGGSGNNHGNDGNGNNGDGNNGGGNGGNNGGGNGNNGNGNGHGRGHRDAGQAAGTFLIMVRGYFATDPGSGDPNTATVSATTVSFHAQVKDDGGHSFSFDATNLRITDNYHFSGSGTIGAAAVTIEGHVDPTDPASRGNGQNSPVVSNPRLECTYTTTGPASRHSGRVVGSMAPPPAPASSSH